MLDRPTTKDQWIARARATTPDGRAFINGHYVNAKSGKTFDKISSADGTVAGQVADCDAADIDLAVSAAKTAFEDGRWRDKPATEKKRILLRFAELIKQHTDEIAIRETLDVGKVISNSVAIDVPYCYACIQYYAELADKMYDEIAPMSPNDLVQIRKEPLGVIGAIVPWNYPLIISAWTLGPALLAGNSVVLKPAEQSPFASLYLGGLAREAGVVIGDVDLPQPLVRRLYRVDAGKPELLRQAVLQGPEDAFRPASRLGRIGGDVFDPQLPQRPTDLRQTFARHRFARLGRMEIMAAAIRVERTEQAVRGDRLAQPPQA